MDLKSEGWGLESWSFDYQNFKSSYPSLNIRWNLIWGESSKSNSRGQKPFEKICGGENHVVRILKWVKPNSRWLDKKIQDRGAKSKMAETKSKMVDVKFKLEDGWHYWIDGPVPWHNRVICGCLYVCLCTFVRECAHVYDVIFKGSLLSVPAFADTGTTLYKVGVV